MKLSRSRVLKMSAGAALGSLPFRGVSATPAGQGSGPSRTFDQLLLFLSDNYLPTPRIEDLARLDPNFSFLREIMGFSPAQINHFRADAEAFFRNRFGLDFIGIPADPNNVKVIPGVAMLMPMRFASEAHYRVVHRSGSGELQEYPEVRDGGLVVVTLSGGWDYTGEYGGAGGIPAAPGEMLLFGFYNIPGLGDGSHPGRGKGPLVISYHSDAPMRTTVDGDGTIKCAVHHSAWGPGGARGLFTLIPVGDGRGHLTIRNVLTFPTNLPDA